MAEWSKAHAWKVCIRQKRIEGSNPFLSAKGIHAIGVDFSFEEPSKARFCEVLKMKNINLRMKVVDSMLAPDILFGISNPIALL